jgi:hypothetical protein
MSWIVNVPDSIPADFETADIYAQAFLSEMTNVVEQEDPTGHGVVPFGGCIQRSRNSVLPVND